MQTVNTFSLHDVHLCTLREAEIRSLSARDEKEQAPSRRTWKEKQISVLQGSTSVACAQGKIRYEMII